MGLAGQTNWVHTQYSDHATRPVCVCKLVVVDTLDEQHGTVILGK